MRISTWVVLAAAAAIGCGGGGDDSQSAPAPKPAAAPTAAPAPAAPAAPRRDALTGGPYPALLVTQAHFVDQVVGGKTQSLPGPARLIIVRDTGDGWKPVYLDDPDSNVMHKAIPYDGGILTIGGNQALLRVWHFRDGAWKADTHWNPKFGGRFDRLRDFEMGDVDGDGKPELVVATHDQGVIAVLHPDENWRVEEVDRTPNTFVHEIEIGDVDGDGVNEFFATPSKPNKLDQQQPGEVVMFRHSGDGWTKSVVDAPAKTHAKEILAADVDRNGRSELYVVWEGAVGAGGALVEPVAIHSYAWGENDPKNDDGTPKAQVVATVSDRQMRAITAGDVNHDGKIDLVAGSLSAGLFLFEAIGNEWKPTPIDTQSSGYEHPVHVADLDGDGKAELYVAAEDQGELRRYLWDGQRFVKTVLMPLGKGDITWNVMDGVF